MLPDHPAQPSLAALGRVLESSRRGASKSARVVAQAAGISAVYLRVLETATNPKTGRASRPSVDVLIALARELSLDANELLTLAGYTDLSVDRDLAAQLPDSGRDELSPALEALAASLDRARTRPSDFLRVVLAEDVARFVAHVAAVAGGSLRCGYDDERRLTMRALRSACNASLDAVSYDPDAAWLGSYGAAYLQRHRELIADSRGSARVTRIFLLAPEQEAAYAPLLAEHASIGLGTYVADPLDVPTASQQDITLYDRSLLREAAGPASAGGGRYVEFTDDVARIERAEADFLAVLAVARPFS